jgi:AcrR family transcriptional regulator
MAKPIAPEDPQGVDTGPSIREANVETFLDAAERLLIREGAAGISTRQLAREAGQNHGLLHYYFGSVEEVGATLNAALVVMGDKLGLYRARHRDRLAANYRGGAWRRGRRLARAQP